MQVMDGFAKQYRKNMKEFENRLITFTQAAHILGYKNYRSVLRLIKEGYLKEYEIPHTKRRRLALTDVMKVAVPEQVVGSTQEPELF